MEYHFSVIGLNHKTSPLGLREAVSFTRSQVDELLKLLKTIYPLQEFAIVSTCNRVELYAGSRKENIETDRLISSLATFHNLSPDYLLPAIYTYRYKKALLHLFEVASSIDSLVVGEAQILGQLKRSYRQAVESGATGTVLNTVFQQAFAVGKKVRTLTKIGEGNVSISSIGCQLAKEILKDLSGKKIVLVGTGKIGAATLKSLRVRGADTVFICSRRYTKAKTLANEFHGIALRFEEIEDFLTEADVLISATSAPTYIFHTATLKRIMGARDRRPIILIDLAIPRDIDPLASRISGIHLYNIDSLTRIADHNIKKRKREIVRCREIITQEVDLFVRRNIIVNRYYNFTCREMNYMYPLLLLKRDCY